LPDVDAIGDATVDVADVDGLHSNVVDVDADIDANVDADVDAVHSNVADDGAGIGVDVDADVDAVPSTLIGVYVSLVSDWVIKASRCRSVHASIVS
jgi:hypothetical protein